MSQTEVHAMIATYWKSKASIGCLRKIKHIIKAFETWVCVFYCLFHINFYNFYFFFYTKWLCTTICDILNFCVYVTDRGTRNDSYLLKIKGINWMPSKNQKKSQNQSFAICCCLCCVCCLFFVVFFFFPFFGYF